MLFFFPFPQNCKNKLIKCLILSCRIYNLQPKREAFIHINGTMVNSTLMSHYPKIDSIKIHSIANISIPVELKIHTNKSDDRTSASTHAYPELLDLIVDKGVPLWIFIIAIIGGILLLALITYLLWRFGFFKRQRPDHTLTGNISKNSESRPFIANGS